MTHDPIYRTVPLDRINAEPVTPPPSLVRSIENNGEKVPVILRPVDTGAGTAYAVVDGLRRIAAVRQINKDNEWAYIPAIVVTATDPEAAETGLIGNLARDANPAAESEMIRALQESGADMDALPKRLGISAGTFRNRLRLLKLAPELFARLKAGDIKANAALTALHLPPAVQNDLAATEGRITNKDVNARLRTVRQDAISGLETPRPSHDTPPAPNGQETQGGTARNATDAESTTPNQYTGLAMALEAASGRFGAKARAIMLEAARLLRGEDNK